MILEHKRVAHFFAGSGGSTLGMKQAGWTGTFAVEVAKDRCQTLRANHPEMAIFEGPIQQMTLADYPPESIEVHFHAFPCTNYTYGANVHGHWSGDSLYLEALRESMMLWPEIIVVENVLGMRKFPRVMETWRNLPGYHTTELVLHGEDFTMQKKARVFLILHRQKFNFQVYAKQQQQSLKDCLDPSASTLPLAPYILKRFTGGYNKKYKAKIYHPEQREPVNLFTNYKRDRSNFLILDAATIAGVRPFSVREVARLHGFPDNYEFHGNLNQQYGQIIDAVMPPMGQAIGEALNAYFDSISALAPQLKSLGHRSVAAKKSTGVNQMQIPMWVNATKESEVVA